MSETSAAVLRAGQRSSPELCPPFLAAMQILGKRWNGALIQAIRFDESRFVDLKDLVEGISDGVLAARLRELTACGLVERRPSSRGAARSRYGLTPKGQALLPILDDLTTWSDLWSPSGGMRSSATHCEGESCDV